MVLSISALVHLAQVNIALAREPLDAPLLAEFMAALGPVNARADAAPGFVWRMQTEDGDATAVRGFGENPQLIINLTTWDSLEAMREFVYRDPGHLAVMRRRREWFERVSLHTALWWAPAGHKPSVAEAEDRLEHLRACGARAYAFTFRRHFAPHDPTLAVRDDRWLCPA